MRAKYKVGAVFTLAALVLATAFVYLRTKNFPVLETAGPLAAQEKHLLIIASSMTLIVLIPVFFMITYISLKYRESNTKAKYNPDWDHNRLAETIWWGVPILLIAILAVITWHTSHTLDPFRPLASNTTPLKVQVVALEWKWLFIYPDEGVATVNYLEIPTGRPIDMEITADAPMNSLWIPQLSGQIYAMSGMSTQLHIQADKAGSYRGVSANISGKGFAGMHFAVQAVDANDFSHWVTKSQHSSNVLTHDLYHEKLAIPSENEPVAVYRNAQPNLYQLVLDHYMPPTGDMHMYDHGTATVSDSNASSPNTENQ